MAEVLANSMKANYNSEEWTAQAFALDMAWAHTVLPLVQDVKLTFVTSNLRCFMSFIIEVIIKSGIDAKDLLEKVSCAMYFHR